MGIPTNWYETFFTGTFVDWWLKATPPEQTRLEADFLKQALQVRPPARLLDVPCGGGRHSLALAARGYQLTAVDISAEFLAVARSRAAEQGGAVAWEQRDMRQLPWAAEFDGAFCFGNSFGYADEAGNADFVRAVARALKPGARFVLDVSYVMEVVLPTLQERAWYPCGDVVVLADRHYDPARGRLDVEYTAIGDGKVEKRAMTARIYSYREVAGLLEAAGLTDIQGFGSLAREPFRLKASRLLMVATKPG